MGREASIATPGPSSLEVTGESLKNIHVLTALWFKEVLDAKVPAKMVLICTSSISRIICSVISIEEHDDYPS